MTDAETTATNKTQVMKNSNKFIFFLTHINLQEPCIIEASHPPVLGLLNYSDRPDVPVRKRDKHPRLMHPCRATTSPFAAKRVSLSLLSLIITTPPPPLAPQNTVCRGHRFPSWEGGTHMHVQVQLSLTCCSWKADEMLCSAQVLQPESAKSL